ncbi:hypothetical protein FKG94_03095 [Exilibacterium tricleocarpae]|uniref:Bacteriophage tail tape measure N-terminal domain-containing protein n=1 Tax=Exilibacterium tricleocarpae TaxID=2591008 RepID=A0A545U6T7_9GAMM|nr:phage tail length tape measure family protein [Exilibacterium tricleocarpae]TQV85190.1 hypothetical protein FKG94_03095 [Exilibacterium tricleocarpae]
MPRRVIETLITELKGDGTSLRRELNRSVVDTQDWGKRISRTLKTAVGVISLAAVVNKVRDATAEQEDALAQLQQTLLSTNNAVGVSFDDLVAKASELQDVTVFGDEKIIRAQSQLATFTRITGDEFQRSTELALDLAKKFQGDLRSAALQLGKALNDPVANLGALSRAGIQFDKGQKELIKTLFESGRVADAQRVILKELETQFGGSARAARETFGGALQGLKNAFGDLFEVTDNLDNTTADIETLTALLKDPATVQAVQVLTSAIIKGFTAATQAIAGTVNLVKSFAESVAADISGVAVGDFDRLNRQLDRLTEKRAALFRQAEAFGTNPAEDPRVQALDLQIRKTQELLDLSNSLKAAVVENSGPSAGEGVATPEPGVTPVADLQGVADTLNQQTNAKELQESLRKSAEEELVGFEKKLSLLDATTEKQRVLFELEKGRFAALSEGQKEALLGAAARVDAAETQKQLLSELAGIEQLLKDDVQRVNDVWDARIAIIQRTVDEEAKASELIAKAEKQRTEELESLKDETPKGFDSIFGAGELAQLFTDFDNIEDRFKGLLSRLIVEAAGAQLSQVLGLGGTTTSGTTGIFSSLFGGAFAQGGRPPLGRVSVVGDGGEPELFVPDTAGTIVPFSDLGQPQSVPEPMVIVVDSEEKALEALASRRGQDVALDTMRRRASEFRQALGI